MSNNLIWGDYNARCDRCAFQFKASQLRKEWTGLMVCNLCFETRHPQDLIKPPKEDVSVPWSRPGHEDTFVDVTYTTPAGATVPPAIPEGTFNTE